MFGRLNGYVLLGWLLLAGGVVKAQTPPAEVLVEIEAVLTEAWLFGQPNSPLDPQARWAAWQTIDPYLRWLEAPSRSSAPSLASGVIGAQLQVDGSGIWLWPYQGGPLARSGLRDEIPLALWSVDGQVVRHLDAQAIAALLRGVAGSAVVLEFVSADHRIESVQVWRQPFTPLAVEEGVLGSVRVLRIYDFKARATRNALRRMLLDPPYAEAATWVIDLRGSGGGELYEALDSAALFLAPGSLLGWLVHRDERQPVQSASSQPRALVETPLVLLMGPGTASAAEIFAGALRQHGRAVLMGTASLGKCLSQTEQRLSDGSRLRFTNLEYRLPDQQPCPVGGLRPDVVTPTISPLHLDDYVAHGTHGGGGFHTESSE